MIPNDIEYNQDDEDDKLEGDMEEKILGMNDLYYFIKHILGYKELREDTHRPICKELQSDDPKNLELLLELPRDTFKTTIGTIGFAIWVTIQTEGYWFIPNVRIKLNHKIMSKAREKLVEIKGIYTSNEKFISLYGRLKGNKWGTDAITLNNRTKDLSEPTISIGGVDHEETSGHYDIIDNDDLPGLKDMYSGAERKKVLRYYKSLRYLRDKRRFKRELNIMTRWNLLDLHKYLVETKVNMQQYIKKALIENADGTFTSLFPERYSVEELITERTEDPIMFESQRQNNPVEDSTQIYKHDDLNFYDADVADVPNGIKYAYMDLALSQKSTADYTALIVGNNAQDKIYIPYAWIARANPATVKIKVAEVCKDYGIRKLGIESNSFQEIYVDDIKAYLKEQKVNTEIIKVKHSTNKQGRINSMHGLVVGKTYFREDWSNCYPKLISQLIGFPQAKHDDAPDALEGLLSMYNSVKPIRIRHI